MGPKVVGCFVGGDACCMVARAVMKAWQEGLGGSPPMGRVYRPLADECAATQFEHKQPLSVNDNGHVPSTDEGDEDPEIRVAKCEDIVPRRPGTANGSMPDEGFWSSHLFWKGIVVGALIVLLAKTAMDVRAPFGIDWYRF